MSDSKSLSTAAGVTFLAGTTVWVTAAVVMVLWGAGWRAWVAWALCLLLIVLVAGVAEAVVNRPRKGRARNLTGHPPTRTLQVIDTVNRDLAEADRIRDDIESRQP